MKPVSKMSLEEIAAFVCQALQTAGITVTLTGGACVAIWSEGRYVSDDLDFVEEGPVTAQEVQQTLAALGFKRRGRHFTHPETKLLVEFPTGPLTIGDERIHNFNERTTATGKLRLLSPTDCVKDRLTAYFHWNDRQALEQAILVATAQKIDIAEVRRWSKSEQNEVKFEEFKGKLQRL